MHIDAHNAITCSSVKDWGGAWTENLLKWLISPLICCYDIRLTLSVNSYTSTLKLWEACTSEKDMDCIFRLSHSCDLYIVFIYTFYVDCAHSPCACMMLNEKSKKHPVTKFKLTRCNERLCFVGLTECFKSICFHMLDGFCWWVPYAIQRAIICALYSKSQVMLMR